MTLPTLIQYLEAQRRAWQHAQLERFPEPPRA